MKTIHFIMQGKGGVGKTLCASLLAQYLKEQGYSVLCFDSDPINGSFSHYKDLNVQTLTIFEKDSTVVNSGQFDILIECIKNAPEHSHIVVDSGASTFGPLITYLHENEIWYALGDILGEEVKLFLHCPIIAGAAQDDTVVASEVAIRKLNADAVVLWLNAFFGDLPEKHYTQWNVFKSVKDNIVGAVHLKRYNADTFGKDIQQQSKLGLTFKEVEQSDFRLMSKHRLRLFKNDVFTQLDAVFHPNADIGE